MADEDLGPEGFSARGVPSARRGYDKRVIDNLIKEAGARWAELKQRYDELAEAVAASGGLEYLTRDLSQIGEQVGNVLTAAAEAAEGLRSRAREDADRVASEAEEAAATRIDEAEKQAFEIRRDAWETGVELLDLVRDTVAAMIAAAEDDALGIRADAEREAHRRMNAVRKEMDDLVRSTRYDVDRQLNSARELAAEMLEQAGGDSAAEGEAAEGKQREVLAEIEKIKTSRTIEDVTVLPATPPPSADELLYGELDPKRAELSDALAAEVGRLTEDLPDIDGAEGDAEDDPPGAPRLEAVVGGNEDDDVGTLFEALRTTSDEPLLKVVDEPNDPVDLRDRLVLPAHNAGVRELKRRIVDLQNVALDALRTGRAWAPDAEAITDRMRPAMEPALQKAAASGVEAARMLAGVVGEQTNRLDRARGMVDAMAQDLATQLRSAMSGDDNGDPSTTLSRVFRVWRNDQADRWVNAIVTAAYHDSLAGAFAAGGVAAVTAVAAESTCQECPAGRTWDPSQAPPEGTRMPPAHLDCSCALAPGT